MGSRGTGDIDKEKKKISIAEKLGVEKHALFEILNHAFLIHRMESKKDAVGILDELLLKNQIMGFNELKYFAVVGLLEFMSRYNAEAIKELWQL